MEGGASKAEQLPSFIFPMLARLGEPFESKDHLFEWKWDGFRAVIFRDRDGIRVRSRRDNDLGPRFPELETLMALPPGTAVDGEIVILENGKPSFERVLQRERSRGTSGQSGARISRGTSSTPGIPNASRAVPPTPPNVSPAFFVVFDLLFENYRPRMDQPLLTRRAALEALVHRFPDAKMVFSEGVVGAGLALFEQAVARDFEGVVAKRLNSLYLPGQRTDAWTKFKKSTTVLCVILGYLTDELGSLRSIIVGTDIDGTLTCVGRVGSGFDEHTRRILERMLPQRRREACFVETDLDGIWVEPGIFCKVSYVERTGAGMLRAAVFKELVVG